MSEHDVAPVEVVRRGYDALSLRYRADDAPAGQYGPWIAELIRRTPADGRVLDVGCGCGVPVARDLAAAGLQVTGVDLSDVQINRARTLVPTAHFEQGDVTTMSWPTGSFDTVVALYSLIHVPLHAQPWLLTSLADSLVDDGTLLLVAGRGPGPGPSKAGSVARARCGGAKPTPAPTGRGSPTPASASPRKSSYPKATPGTASSGPVAAAVAVEDPVPDRSRSTAHLYGHHKYMSLSDAASGLPMYLGPALPRWQPRTIEDVQAAIDDGTLRERHWLDVKAEAGTSEGAKKGLAKDLASFANDGGALLIGVREDKPAQTITVEPVLLDGLSETVDQIARARCDPPPYVVCHRIEAPSQADGKARGVLLVEVPPSPSAPLMVDHRYYGRGDTTNHHLTDGEVARLHAMRTARQATAEQLIAAEVLRDPVPPGTRQRSHLYVVAQPLASPPDLLTNQIENPRLHSVINEVPSRFPPGVDGLPGKWQTLRNSEPRAEGRGFRSYGLSGRQFVSDLQNAKEDSLLDVEVHDNGRVTLFGVPFSNRENEGPDIEKRYISDSEIVALTRAIVTLAGQLGSSAGYGGRWLLAVGVSDLHGKLSHTVYQDPSGRLNPPQFSATSYVQGTEAMTVELLTHPGAVTQRLVGRLLRAFGTGQYHLHKQLLTDTDPT